jgi:hypothetical protein
MLLQMGAGQSRSSSTDNSKQNGVFHDELIKLNEIVNAVMTADDRFVDSNYNFLFEDVCQNYTMVWEKELDKHLKVDLETVHGSIYIVPKKDIVDDEANNTRASKNDLCKEIAKHYIKILYVIALIKRVYDLENSGDNSIAGIMERNIKIVDGVMQINYCSIPHKDYVSQGTASNVDFSNLEGLYVFVENFLTPVERHIFVEQLKAVFARKQKYRVEEMVCNDTLVTLDEYNNLYKRRYNKHFTCSNVHEFKREHSVDLMFEVAANNPVMHSKHCYSRKQVLIPLTNATRDETIKGLVEVYKEMRQNYIRNVDLVLAILGRLIVKDDQQYKLKDIDTTELEAVVHEVKRVVIMFYVQSIVDFQSLLDYALSLENTIESAS